MALPALVPDHWLRPALPADVPAMAALINRYADEGLMLPKTEAALYRSIRDYVVVVDLSGRLCACGGLRVYSRASAEIIGLAVGEAWRGRGLGGLVVDHLVRDARMLGVGRVFALTLSEPFFHRHGFTPIPRAMLPEKEEADCASCPRRHGCRERAVQRRIPATVGPSPGLDRLRSRTGEGLAGRALPVLATARA